VTTWCFHFFVFKIIGRWQYLWRWKLDSMKFATWVLHRCWR
jgi:hypothetical protein